MKRCYDCKKLKSITEFYRDKKKKDKHDIYCKECTAIRNAKYREKYNGLPNVWNGMKQRCYYKKNISFKRYGGKGITICKEWKNSFLTFYEWTKNKYRKGFTIGGIRNLYNVNYEYK